MVTKWITKKGNDGENRHIPITEGNRVREKEISLDEQSKRSAINNMDDKTKLLYQLGFIDEDGKLNTYPYLLNSFLNTPGDDKIHNLIIVKDNKIEFLATDTLGQTTLKTIMPNNIHLEEGKYGLYYDETNNSFNLKKLDTNDTRIDVKDYKNTSYPEGFKIRIDGKPYEQMMTRLNYFGPDEKYLLIIKKIGKGNYAEMHIIETNHNFHDTIYFKIPDKYVERDIFAIVDGKAFKRALKMINGKKFSGSIDLDIQTQYYPLILYKKDEKSHTDKYGIVEPAHLEDYNYDAPVLHY